MARIDTLDFEILGCITYAKQVDFIGTIVAAYQQARALRRLDIRE